MNRQLIFLIAAVTLIAPGALRAAGKSEVADAVMKGDKAALRTLLQQKADVNAPQVDGATALHWAVYRNDFDAAGQLIRAGAKADVANREGVTPVAMAALYGQSQMLEALIKAGADAKQKNGRGETLVMFAARSGSPDAIKLLVANGAEVNAKETVRGTTALMWAVEQRHPSAAKMLVELGADVGARSAGAGLPRNYMAPRVDTSAVDAAAKRHQDAIAAGRSYNEQLEWDAAHGAQIRLGFRGTLNADGTAASVENTRRPGLTAAAPAPPPAPDAAAPPEADDVDVIVAGLVGAGGGGLTPLIFAAREGSIESAKALIDGGANVNQTSEYGWTPLLTATNNRNYKLAKYLIERGADVNIANKGGWTPLYLATDNRNIEGGDYPVPKPDLDHLEFIEFLLTHDADPNARAKDNTLTRTIFTMQWFYENGATPFVRAAQSSDVELMQLLLDYGADPFIATENGDTALTASAGIGWVEGVTYERSPEDSLKAARMLLDLGLDPNARNREGRTPLMVPRSRGARRSSRCSSIAARNSTLATTAAATPTTACRSSPATRGRQSITPTVSSEPACSRPSRVLKPRR